MAMIYASLIIKGKKTFSQVPERLKEQVREILIDCECEYLLEDQLKNYGGNATDLPPSDIYKRKI